MVSTTWLTRAAVIDKRKSMIVFKGHRTPDMNAHYFLRDAIIKGDSRGTSWTKAGQDLTRVQLTLHAHMHKHAKHRLAL